MLDTLMERMPQKTIKVHYSLLEANDNGDVQSENCHRRSTLKYLVDTDNKVCLAAMHMHGTTCMHAITYTLVCICRIS